MPPFSWCNAREHHVARAGHTGGYGVRGDRKLPRSLSTKQVVGLVKAALPYGRAQAIIPLSADAVSMPQTLGA